MDSNLKRKTFYVFDLLGASGSVGVCAIAIAKALMVRVVTKIVWLTFIFQVQETGYENGPD